MILLALLRGVAATLGRAAYALGIRSEVTDSNLQRAFPELSREERRVIARRSYANIAIVFFEFLFLRTASRRAIYQSLEIHGEEALLSADAEGRGVIALSGHIANWEWVAIALGVKLGKPFRLVVKNQRSKRADLFLQSMRSRFGNTTVEAGNVRGIFAALARQEWLAVLADQAAPASSVRVSFFGVAVPTFEGVARLALRTRAPVVFIRSWRTPNGYACQIEPIDYADITESTPNAVELLTARHVAVLENAIRTQPELWVWQHRRWKDADR